MFRVRQNSYAEILNPKVMVLGGRVGLGWWLGHKGGALKIGISALIRETTQS